MPDFVSMSSVNISLLIFSVLVTLCILIAAVTATTRKRKFMRSFAVLLVSDIIVQLGEIGIWFFEGSQDMAVAVKICAVMSYGVGSMLIGFLTYCLAGFAGEKFLSEKEKISLVPARIMTAACGLVFLFVFTSIWTGLVFTVDSAGYISDGACMGVVCIFEAVTFIAEIVLALYYRRFLPIKGLILIIGHCFVQIGILLLKNIWYPVPMYLMDTISFLLIFVVFHTEFNRQLASEESEMSDKRVAIMLSQIQPHFLYNALNSIYYLCDKDAKLAKQGINDFSEYLRYILGSLDRKKPVGFDEELQYVKIYLNLESMRFGEDLNIVYHIETTDFQVPALSVQPLVENAVKHGICRREDGGIIIISARECEKYYEIEITDDGVGFDVNNIPDTGKMHVGIENVRQRINSMCGGELVVESTPGKGTTAKIYVPKENKI